MGYPFPRAGAILAASCGHPIREKVEATRCLKLNGGFIRCLWPDWSAAADGLGSDSRRRHLAAGSGQSGERSIASVGRIADCYFPDGTAASPHSAVACLGRQAVEANLPGLTLELERVTASAAMMQGFRRCGERECPRAKQAGRRRRRWPCYPARSRRPRG